MSEKLMVRVYEKLEEIQTELRISNTMGLLEGYLQALYDFVAAYKLYAGHHHLSGSDLQLPSPYGLHHSSENPIEQNLLRRCQLCTDMVVRWIGQHEWGRRLRDNGLMEDVDRILMALTQCMDDFHLQRPHLWGFTRELEDATAKMNLAVKRADD